MLKPRDAALTVLPKIHSLSLRQLETFTTVAREGGFARASRVLLISEAGVSEQIKRLEDMMGSSLMKRSRGRGPVELTEAGRMLLVGCEEVLARLNRVLRDIEGLQGTAEGSFVFGAAPNFVGYWVPGLYQDFQKRHPTSAMRIDLGPRGYLLERVQQGNIDLAVARGPVRGRGLASELLCEEDFVLVGPPGHPLEVATNHDFRALASESLIASEASSVAQRALEERARESGVDLCLVWEVSNIEARINAVSRGLGIALVPFYTVRPLLANHTLSLLRVSGLPIRLHQVIIYPPDRLSGPARAFKDYLVELRSAFEATCLCEP